MSFHHQVRAAIGVIVLASGLMVLDAPARTESSSRRALIIGINDYRGDSDHATSSHGKVGRSWESLKGAVADARAFRDMLTERYGFAPKDIVFLADAEATRARILESLDGWLLSGAGKGDLRLFYYAGHGSQVTNSKSSEADQRDETLVPADAPRGAPDIRDKELARRFDRAARAGVELTVVLDSCHSGSATRGIQAGRARRLSPADFDVADGEPAPDPTLDGALVMAAAQDRELAREVDDDGEPHGAFTLAFIKALRSLPPNESLEHVFRKTRAIMQRDGRGQEPDLRGPEARKQRSLVGLAASGAAEKLVVAVRNVSGRSAIELQGGRAEELSVGCELIAYHADGGTVRIRITAVKGLAASTAEIVNGRVESVRPGDLFELDRWVAPERPDLTVWLPPALAVADGSKMAHVVDELRAKRRDLAFSSDPTVLAPTHIICWDGEQWALLGPEGATKLGKHPSAADLEKAFALLTPSTRVGESEKPAVFFQVPPPPSLAQSLDLGEKSRNSAISVETEGKNAQYVLAGRIQDGRRELAWIQVRLSSTALRDGSPLPLRSDWVRVDAAEGTSVLTDYAVKLGRVRGWLLLENARDSFFPYRIRLRGTGAEARSSGVVKQGEEYQLVLRTDGPPPGGVLPRYVYVFAIDQSGQAQLLFPPGGGGGGENRLPFGGVGGTPSEIDLHTRIRVGPPYGTDTYVMLASDEPLADPEVLQFSGVTTTRGAIGPLERLLGSVGRRVRGAQKVAVPTNWSIDRASFRSEPLKRDGQ